MRLVVRGARCILRMDRPPLSSTIRRSMAPNSQQWPQQPYINGACPYVLRRRALYRPRESPRLILEVAAADPRTPMQRTPRGSDGRAGFHTCAQLCPCESERASERAPARTRVVQEARSIPDARSSPSPPFSLLSPGADATQFRG